MSRLFPPQAQIVRDQRVHDGFLEGIAEQDAVAHQPLAQGAGFLGDAQAGVVAGRDHDLDPVQAQRAKPEARQQRDEARRDPLATAGGAHPIDQVGQAVNRVDEVKPAPTQQDGFLIGGTGFQDREGEIEAARPEGGLVFDPVADVRQGRRHLGERHPGAQLGQRFVDGGDERFGVFQTNRAEGDHPVGEANLIAGGRLHGVSW